MALSSLVIIGYKCDGLTFSESMNPKEVVQWLVKEVGQSENPKILKLLTIFEGVCTLVLLVHGLGAPE